MLAILYHYAPETFHRMQRWTWLWVGMLAAFLLYVRRSEEHTSELQSPRHLGCRLLLEKKKKKHRNRRAPIPRLQSHADRKRTSLISFCIICRLFSLRLTCIGRPRRFLFFFFLNDTAPTEIYPLPLHDALPICRLSRCSRRHSSIGTSTASSTPRRVTTRSEEHTSELQSLRHLVCRLLLEK